MYWLTVNVFSVDRAGLQLSTCAWPRASSTIRLTRKLSKQQWDNNKMKHIRGWIVKCIGEDIKNVYSSYFCLATCLSWDKNCFTVKHGQTIWQIEIFHSAYAFPRASIADDNKMLHKRRKHCKADNKREQQWIALYFCHATCLF